MELTQLKHKNRYTFYYKDTQRHYFRANFLGVFSNNTTTYVILNKSQEKNGYISNSETWYVDVRLILNIKTLLDLVDSSCVIPDDMLNEINNYW
jgi:hypothetical protein